jgi:hypothetical protein
MATINYVFGESLGRRARRKFPIEQDVRYQCVKGTRISAAGQGKTVEISSREIRFTTSTYCETDRRCGWPSIGRQCSITPAG